jgi:hypothetical protein
MRPDIGSIAINNGNPNDASDAQNAPIVVPIDAGVTEGCFAFSSIIYVTVCNNSYAVPSGNYTYMQSGVYQDTLMTTCGIDSLVIINLSIGTPQFITDVITICDSITWVDGITYFTSSSTIKDTLISIAGCDSIVCLNLTILQFSLGIALVSACDSYPWSGITYTSNNNTAQDTLVNSVGFDSVVTLNLTILNSTSFTDVINSCSPITWIDVNTYNQTTNSPVFTITNSQGCDSVVTLDFILLQADTSVIRNNLTLTAQAGNATYPKHLII